MDGILLLDKPIGPTSNHVLKSVRRWAGTRKVGHTGTLDPLASGLLPVVIGRATRLAPFLTLEPKRYEATVQFGATTETGDAQGRVLVEGDSGVAAPPGWSEVIARHIGVLELSVPLYAAVKVDGRPLYKYARAGHDVELPVRSMRVLDIESDTTAWPTVRLNVTCGTGTYIRSLAESLGRACGCGAHVTALRRTQVGPWNVRDAVSPESLPAIDKLSHEWITLDAALSLKTLRLSDDQARFIRVGRRPEELENQACVHIAAGERFAFTDTRGGLLAVARSKEAWAPSAMPPQFDFERVMVES
jgi:tRNA pseudouridine55 synthase